MPANRVYVLGGWQTDFSRNFQREGQELFDVLRETALETLARTGVAPEELDTAHVGNFTAELFCRQGHLGGLLATTEYMTIDHLGITAPGESWKAIEEGVIAPGGRLPVNPSGGLIGLGHPVGATGVRMLLDAWKQVAGEAGAYQVDGARNVATLNIGGSATTTVSFVVSNEG